MSVIRSRDNARLKAWVRLAGDPRERRKQGVALLEGVHLFESFVATGHRPSSLIVAESAMARPEVARLVERAGGTPIVLADVLFKRISDAEAPVGIAAEIEIPVSEFDPAESACCVFLDGIQDAGNVGTILRSAAAFGIGDAVFGPGCADPWSPKVLRAGMGAHFQLRIMASSDLPSSVSRFGADSICTDVREGTPIDATDLKGRIGWVFGSEGAGISEAVARTATRRVTVPMPGGMESLNVAACAAVCFYERARQISTRDARVSRPGGRS